MGSIFEFEDYPGKVWKKTYPDMCAEVVNGAVSHFNGLVVRLLRKIIFV